MHENVLNEEFDKELRTLNRGQRAAVMHERGRALCIAGPGSGKTRVITMRAMRLLAEFSETAFRERQKVVLTMAFNTAAGAEMRSRAELFSRRFFCVDSKKIMELADFSTIHAFCYRILLIFAREKGKKTPHVLGDDERENIIRKIYSEKTGKRGITADVLKTISRYISAESDMSGMENDPLTENIKTEYERIKRAGNAVDFDDMLKRSLECLKIDENFRKRISGEYMFFQVDEAQDLSPVQREIIDLVGGNNVFFVADDDQSIYGFRGAAPDILKSIASDSADVSRYALNENYRSGEEIVKLASSFIAQNRTRFGKRLFAAAKGGFIKIETFSSSKAEAGAVVKMIFSALKRGQTFSVLYRNNASNLIPLIELFLECRRRKEYVFPLVRGDVLSLSGLIPMRRFAESICENETPRRAFMRLESGREIDLILFSEDVKGKRKFFAETVRTAIEILAENSCTREEFSAILTEIDGFTGKADTNASVCFSSVHSAKGLEFDNVAVVDCVRGEFPTGTGTDKTLDEERRLMYVAMTRARKKLVIAYPRRTGKMSLTASVFIDEIMAL